MSTVFRVAGACNEGEVPEEAPLLIGSKNSLGQVSAVRVDDDHRLITTVGTSSADPVYVVSTSGLASYYHAYMSKADAPATIQSVTGPFNVGGTDLTISVNGGTNQVVSFNARGAQPGIALSSEHPATSNGDCATKLKISVDGGAWKAVEIARGLQTGAAIAAALQSEIRDHVANGTNVTVEYNTVTYPYRYVFTSGSTGVSSAIHVRRAGNDELARLLRLGPYEGVEYTGVAANYYYVDEVVSILLAGTTDIVASVFDAGVSASTILASSSASLQVSAGGANAALQFPTSVASGVTGSTSVDLNVDGSTTPVRFAIAAPENHVFVVTEITIFLRANSTRLRDFGARTTLANGLKIEWYSESGLTIPSLTVVTNADLIAHADDGQVISNGFASNGTDLIKATFRMEGGFRVLHDKSAQIRVIVQDDLTGLGMLRIRAKGWIE